MGHVTMKNQMFFKTIYMKVLKTYFHFKEYLLKLVEEGVFIVVRVVESVITDSITRKFETTGSNFSQETR